MSARRVAVPGGGRVYVVDDDASVRKALTRLLRAVGLEVASFASGDALLLGLDGAGGPTCVVADLRMPGLSGLDLQDELARRGLDLPLLFISGQADVTSSVRAMKGGAVDFLQKPFADVELIDAVTRALSAHRQRAAVRHEREALQSRLARLTPREREVFALVASGRLNKQVGYELGTTEKTVKVHRARVMEKMEAGSLADLVRMAGTLGLDAAPPRPPS